MIFFPLLLILDTSDVQAVNATVVGESTIDIQCWFIHGSDALGCKVVLVSDYPNVSDVYTKLSRSNMSASGQLSLNQNLSCYQRVFAFDIDVNNNTISNLAIEGNITAKAITDCVYYILVSWIIASVYIHVQNDYIVIILFVTVLR